jgi:hypothetical protein
VADDRRLRPVAAEKEAPEMIVDCDEEFAEEELTEEEKEYVMGFCDLDELCLVCPPDRPSTNDLIIVMQRTITSRL